MQNMNQHIQSHNFRFMRTHEPQFDRLGALAERYFRDDPNTCLIKLRQLGELLGQEVAARVGLYTAPEESQANLLRRLEVERAVPPQAMDLFHQIRMHGSRANLGLKPDNQDSQRSLQWPHDIEVGE
jgi:type I restriction enzyme R subunit